MRDVDNSEDILDSRDVQERIDDLEGERGTLADAVEDAETDMTLASHGDGDTTGELTETLETARAALAAWDASEEAEELKILLAFKSEAEDYCDWDSGETLIRESNWVEYVEELVSDIGDLPREIPSYIEIDWEKTAENVRVDYSEAEFDGVTYLFRCH